ncbi:MAG: phosphonate ABC transporter ATP-binding protein [Deltaproteobacteria bacterium]|nr:phosphonate ABC transporter ATP-binding protein [Deltaproteobacteria bacterium]
MLKLRALTMVYPNGFVGLHPVTLELARGQFTVLIGQSGAGKSTLLRCLNYLNRPTGGSLEVAGLGLIQPGPVLREHRRRTGIVFQQHQLIGRHTALENVLVGRLGHRRLWGGLLPFPPAEVELALDCLERVGLLDKALERVDRLSGGQQQRVGIARALSQQPVIMLADEPVASLDPATSQRVLEVLAAICREDGITAVVSLHQIELARQFADRVIGLAGGRVTYDGPPEGLGEATLHGIYHGADLAA